MRGKRIHTFRPYYIDTERLYDMYSTVMDGYSDEEEIVEIVRSSDQKSKKRNKTFEFVVSSLTENKNNNFSTSVNTGLVSDNNRIKQNENEVQKTATRKLSQCVLLNWMLDKMTDDRYLLKPETRWYKPHVVFNWENVGMPVVLQGRIFPNSPRVLSELRGYSKGIKGMFQRIKDKYSNEQNRHNFTEKKYVLLTRQNIHIDSILQQVRIELTLVKDILSAPYAPTTEKEKSFYSDIQRIAKKLEVDVQKCLYEEIDNIFIYSGKKALIQTKKMIEYFLEEYKYIPDKSATLENIDGLYSHIEHIDLFLADLQNSLEEKLRGTEKNNFVFVFNLREEMLYGATYADVLNATSIKCLGLLTNIGTRTYEIEVVALYQ